VPQHSIRLAETKLGAALIEIAEDRLADVIRHYADATASERASKIKLEITVTPADGRREQFGFAVSGTTALSPRQTFETSLYAGINGHDEIEVVEFNPRQLRMFAADATPTESGDNA
jgi:hypothetical protein